MARQRLKLIEPNIEREVTLMSEHLNSERVQLQKRRMYEDSDDEDGPDNAGDEQLPHETYQQFKARKLKQM